MCKLEDVILTACNHEGVAKHCPTRIAEVVKNAGYRRVKELSFPSFEEFKSNKAEGASFSIGQYHVVIYAFKWSDDGILYSARLTSKATREILPMIPCYHEVLFEERVTISKHDDEALRKWYEDVQVRLQIAFETEIKDKYLEGEE